MESRKSDIDENEQLSGVALILLATACLSLMDGAIKYLVGQGFAVVQILAVRSWFIVPVLLIWVLRTKGVAPLRTRRKWAHFSRVVLGMGAPYFFFTALKTMALADATVIFFGSTFIMTALSVPVFKEKVGIHRWSAVIIGFVGVVIAMKPSGDVFQTGALYVVASSISYALFMLSTRWLGLREGAFKQVVYFNVWIGLAASAALPLSFKPMSGTDVAMAGVASALALLGHLSSTRAFALAPVGLLAPFEYSGLLWAGVIGYFFWREIPGQNALVGGAVIVACGLYLVHRESINHRARNRRKTPGDVAADPIVAPALIATPKKGGDPER